jgi:hypothetical protein
VVRTKLAAKIADVRVDAAVKGGEVAAQDIADQVLPTDCGSGYPKQGGEKIKLDCGEIDGRAAAVNCSGASIQIDIAESERGGARTLGSGSSQDGADARHQLGGIEGLGQIIVGSQVQAPDAVMGVAPRCKHKDRSARALTNTAEDVEAVGVRHHNVQQDERVVIGEGAFHTGVAAGSPTDLETLAREVTGDEAAEFGIVVYYQHVFHGMSGLFILKLAEW